MLIIIIIIIWYAQGSKNKTVYNKNTKTVSKKLTLKTYTINWNAKTKTKNTKIL